MNTQSALDEDSFIQRVFERRVFVTDQVNGTPCRMIFSFVAPTVLADYDITSLNPLDEPAP